MRIRLAREQDLDAAAQLWFERMSLLREADPGLALARDAVALWQESARQWLQDPTCGFFVAEAVGELAGWLVAAIKDNAPWLRPQRLGAIVDMALDLHHSRPGLSSALLDQAAEWLRQRDITVLEVQPPAHYPLEEAFWRAQGGRLRSSKFWLKL